MSYKKVPSIKHQNELKITRQAKLKRVGSVNKILREADPKTVELWEETMIKIYGENIPFHEKVKFYNILKL